MLQVFLLQENGTGKLFYKPGSENLNLLFPKLTVEYGKAGSFEFDITPKFTYYDDLQQLKTAISIENDGREIFRGRILNLTYDFNRHCKVYCEGNLAYLCDSVQKVEKYTGNAGDLFTKIINRHNALIKEKTKQYTVGTISNAFKSRKVFILGKSESDSDVNTTKFDYKQIAIDSMAEEWTTTYDYIDSCLLQYCGGYLRTRQSGNTTYIDWLEDYADESRQAIQLGKNLIDVNKELNAEDLFTVLIPLGDDNLTIEKVNKGSNEIVNSVAVELYGRIVRTHVFDNVTDANTLLENGRRYLETNSVLPPTITVKAVDLHITNAGIPPIYLGDRVTFVSPIHTFLRDEASNTIAYTCTKIEYDLTNPGNTIFTFGKQKQTLTERYRKDKNKQNDQAARSGGGGGGGAAAAAAQDAEDAADKNVKEIFDAWITCDKGKATVDIGALYKKLHDADTVINEVGMKMNGVDATVDLYANHQQTVKNGADITTITNKTGIKLDGTQAAIDIFADHDKTIQNGANITTITNKTGIKLDGSQAAIDIFADHTQTVQNGTDISTICNSTGIKLDGTTGTVNIFTTATDATNAKTATAEIVAWAGRDADGKLGSNIALKADLVTIDAKITNITGALTVGDKVTVDRYVEAPGIYTNFLFINNTSASLHTHTFTADGGTITIGGADWTGTAHSFNIADTQYYKNGVSAARTAGVNSVTIESVSRMYTVGDKVHVIARASNGVTKQFDV